MSKQDEPVQLSIVATLYESAKHLPEFIERLRNTAARLFSSFEVILVNDDSPDDSLQVAIELATRVGGIKVLELERRSGHYEAILAGLRFATSEYVFLIDSDLEEPPELLVPLWSALRTSGAEFSVACQETRRKASLLDYGGVAFYTMLRRYGKLDVPPNNLVARLMTRRYVDALIALRERPVSFDAISARAGSRYVTVPAQKGTDSPTTYSLVRRGTLFLDTMLTYTNLAPRVLLLLALIAGIAGAVALLASSRGALRLVEVAAFGVILLSIVIGWRHSWLQNERMRHRPAVIRRVHPR